MVWWREKCSQMLRQPLCGSCIPARHGRQEKSAGIIQCIHSPVSGFYLKKKKVVNVWFRDYLWLLPQLKSMLNMCRLIGHKLTIGMNVNCMSLYVSFYLVHVLFPS